MTAMIPPETIRRNLEEVRGRIAEAARRSGRPAEAVRLVAVTKLVGPGEARALWECGVRDLGENRVQEALRKMDALADLPVEWHMVGRLQTNKAKKVVGAFRLIHSVDSLRLARALDEAAGRRGLSVEALVEVNVSGEPTKAGFQPADLAPALEEMAGLRNLRITGLMTMAPLVADPEDTRPIFARLRELRDACSARLSPDLNLRHLSMGMTQDYQVAIEEGADIVRIGTALFRETT